MGKKDKTMKAVNTGGPWGFVLFTAWVGALVYFEQQAHSFWTVITAFLKACVWPAYVLHAVLGALHIH